MQIKKVEAFPIAIREPTERELAYGKISIRRNVVVRIECEEGLAGYAETAPIPFRWGCEETQESIVSVVNEYVAPLIIGQDASRINYLLDTMTKRVGDLPYARCGICDALYDLNARAANVPISSLLGGVQEPNLKASWSISFKSADEMANEAAWAVSEGYSWVKVKIGSKEPRQDVRNVAAVREAVGERTFIHVDANAGYRYLDAVEILPQIDEFHPRLIEQPVAGWDIEGLAKLRRKLKSPIMADESVRSWRDLKRVIQHGAADAVLMKLAKHGGIRESQKIADLATESGIALYPGVHFATSLAVATSAQFYSTVPDMTPGDFHQGAALLEHDIVQKPLRAQKGIISTPKMPGTGVEIDPALLDHARRSAVSNR